MYNFTLKSSLNLRAILCNFLCNILTKELQRELVCKENLITELATKVTKKTLTEIWIICNALIGKIEENGDKTDNDDREKQRIEIFLSNNNNISPKECNSKKDKHKEFSDCVKDTNTVKINNTVAINLQ